MSTFAPNIRYALRVLLRRPLFASAATLVLALGIGATVAVFSVLDSVVLRPLPLREADRLVAIGAQPPPDAQWTRQTVRLSVVEEWRARAASFEGIGGFAGRSFTWQAPDGPERIAGGAVYGDFFAVLGATMTLGTAFGPDEQDTPVVLGHGFWRQRFGGRADVVGESIFLDGAPYSIVGVLPPDTGLPLLGGQSSVWIPFRDAQVDRDNVFLNVLGRLRPGVPHDTAAPELAAIQSAVETERGASVRSRGVVLRTMLEERSEIVGPTLLALFAGAAVLLLIACANVGTLSITQLIERRHEMAMRSSLGATPWALLRQVMTEHVVLWTIGGVAGIALAVIALRWVLSLEPFANVNAVPFDGRVALFACAVTLGTAVLFALLPALQSSGSNPITVLREDSATSSPSRKTHRWRQALVVTQVALSTVLASCACLFAVSLFNLTSQPIGFRADDMLTFRLQLPPRDYPDQVRRAQFQQALLANVRSLPGIAAAGTTSALPLGTIAVGPVAVEGVEALDDDSFVGFQAVDRQYFAAARMQVLRGRAFEEMDVADGDPVVIVNETFARQYFPGQDPIGKRSKVAPVDGPWLRIVGVVTDVKHAGLDWEYLPEMFLPYEQLTGPSADAFGADLFVVLRGPDAALPTERVLREVVSSLDASLPLMEVATGAEIVAASARRAQLRAALMAGVAAIAVILSSIGLCAVLAQTIAQRRRELGIRMALGASGSALRRMLCARGIGLAAVGIVGGSAMTLAIARYVQSLLFEVSAVEPFVLAGVVGFMFVVSLLAVGLPAWRAAGLDATVAMRNE